MGKCNKKNLGKGKLHETRKPQAWDQSLSQILREIETNLEVEENGMRECET